MGRYMIWALIVLFCQIQLFAQNSHYLYIHNTTNQQFKIKLDHNIYISDSNGKLIIPKLNAGELVFSVLSLQENKNNPTFKIELNDKNQGWDLNMNSNSITLENWITQEKIIPNSLFTEENWWMGSKKKENHFTQMMADLVADSAVLYHTNTIIQSAKYTQIAKTDPILNKGKLVEVATLQTNNTEVPKIDNDLVSPPTIDSITVIANAPIIVDSVLVKHEKVLEDTSLVAKKDSVVVDNPKVAIQTKEKIKIEKHLDTLQSLGRALKYSIEEDGQVEWIDIFIPIEQELVETKLEPIKDTKNEATIKSESSLVVKSTETKEKKIKLNEAVDEKIDSSSLTKNIKSDGDIFDKNQMPALIMYNSDCKELATNLDIDKYRVKLLTLSVEQRFVQMEKYLKLKCISTKQIKALSELFPTEENKFKFFELCYPYVEETTTFKWLIDLLETDGYKTRFKRMTRML